MPSRQGNGERQSRNRNGERRKSSQRRAALLLLAVGSGIGAAALVAADPDGPADGLAHVSERRERVARVEARGGSLLVLVVVRGTSAGDAIFIVARAGRGRNGQGSSAAGGRGHRGGGAGDAAASAGGRSDWAVGGWLERGCGMTG